MCCQQPRITQSIDNSCYSSRMSYRRDAANRGNSLRSTGPRSQEGKARSSQNSLRYAFLSRELLLPGEDSKQLSKLRERLREEFKPKGPTEEILVQIMVSDLWRLGRLYRVESAIFSGETVVRADVPKVIMESTPQRIFEGRLRNAIVDLSPKRLAIYSINGLIWRAEEEVA